MSEPVVTYGVQSGIERAVAVLRDATAGRGAWQVYEFAKAVVTAYECEAARGDGARERTMCAIREVLGL